MVKNTENLLISIIVASYNYGRYLRENLESLLNQTYKNIEVIVVDDGSTDESLDIINEYVKKDSRFKLITHENHANLGLNESLKKAISFCNGEYIAFCESDDFFKENHIEEKVKYIKKYSDADVIVSDFIPFGNDAKSVEGYLTSKGLLGLYKHLKSIKKPKNIFFETYLNCWVFPTFSIVMVKKEVLTKCNLDAPSRCGTDVWLWRQLMLKYKTGYVDKKMTYYRRSGEALITADIDEKTYIDSINKLIIKDVKNYPLPPIFSPRRKLVKKVKKHILNNV